MFEDFAIETFKIEKAVKIILEAFEQYIEEEMISAPIRESNATICAFIYVLNLIFQDFLKIKNRYYKNFIKK